MGIHDVVVVGAGFAGVTTARELATGGRRDPNDRTAVQRAIGAYLPNAAVTASTGHDWTTDRYALGTWPSFRPGQITRDERALSAPEGRIAFAGSETARRWPTYIEGAIESGFRAARETADLLAA